MKIGSRVFLAPGAHARVEDERRQAHARATRRVVRVHLDPAREARVLVGPRRDAPVHEDLRTSSQQRRLLNDNI